MFLNLLKNCEFGKSHSFSKFSKTSALYNSNTSISFLTWKWPNSDETCRDKDILFKNGEKKTRNNVVIEVLPTQKGFRKHFWAFQYLRLFQNYTVSENTVKLQKISCFVIRNIARTLSLGFSNLTLWKKKQFLIFWFWNSKRMLDVKFWYFLNWYSRHIKCIFNLILIYRLYENARIIWAHSILANRC